MPATYVITTDEMLKYVQVSGKTHLSELRSLAERYFEDPQFDPEIRFLVDLTDLVNARASFIDVFTLKGFYKRNFGKLAKPVDVAIVAPTDLGYGISHMFSAIMLGGKFMQVRIFDDIPSALKWLEIETLDIEKLRNRTTQRLCDTVQ